MTMLRRCLALGLFALVLALGQPAMAQVQDQGRPSDAELQLMQQLQGPVTGRVSIPDQRAATLIQPAGKEWRDFWRGTSPWIGGIAIGGMLALLVLFFLIRGRVPMEGGRSDETITRFNGLDRFTHWMTAISFLVLAVTGLNIAFGRDLLLPLIGPEAFAAFSDAGKLAHNFLSFPFTLGILLMLVLWVRDNIPSRLDLEWIAAGGGLIGHGHAHARRFNGGQKAIFWSVVLMGAAIAATGYILMFPFTVVAHVGGMQTTQMAHSILSMILVAIILAHIYIGTIGMEGAFEAMGSGEVDLNWAEAHHDLWAEEVRAREQRETGAASGAAVPAE
ncbi:MAG: formate dehydrogenase subunit gamma [Geminicoccaceae bacterium]